MNPYTSRIQRSRPYHQVGVYIAAPNILSTRASHCWRSSYDGPFDDDDTAYDLDASSSPPMAPPSYYPPSSDFVPLREKENLLTQNTSESAGRAVALIGPVPEQTFPHSISESQVSTRSALKRGLQIPTRSKMITSEWSMPSVLVEAGVEPESWKTFTKEVQSHARLTSSQIGTLIAADIALIWFLGAIGVGAAGIVNYKEAKHKQHENFASAYRSGSLELVAKRWNKNLFGPLGLKLRIEIPDFVGDGAMKDMDVASTKLFRYQQRKGRFSPAPGELSNGSDPKEARYLKQEGWERTKASRRARIVVLPVEAEASELRT